MYVLQYGLEMVILCVFIVVFVYVVFVIIMGYYFGKVKFEFDLKICWKWLFMALFVFFVIYGLYDFFILQEIYEGFIVFVIVVFIVSIIFVWQLLLEQQENLFFKELQIFGNGLWLWKVFYFFFLLNFYFQVLSLIYRIYLWRGIRKRKNYGDYDLFFWCRGVI